MCGRYVLFSDPEMTEIRQIIEEVQRNNPDIKTGEIFPTNKAPILLQENGTLMPEAYQFNLPGKSALYMAGLWNDFNGERRFTILTVAANESMQEIHNRMPVVLTHPEMDQWIGSYQGALDILQSSRPELIKQLA